MDTLAAATLVVILVSLAIAFLKKLSFCGSRADARL